MKGYSGIGSQDLQNSRNKNHGDDYLNCGIYASFFTFFIPTFKLLTNIYDMYTDQPREVISSKTNIVDLTLIKRCSDGDLPKSSKTLLHSSG